MSDRVYVYGDNNGASYVEVENDRPDGKSDGVQRRTHWDPRLEIMGVAHTVQIGIVPPSRDKSTDEQGLWDTDDGQFLTLSRDGINRAIVALREARDAIYGKDQ